MLFHIIGSRLLYIHIVFGLCCYTIITTPPTTFASCTAFTFAWETRTRMKKTTLLSATIPTTKTTTTASMTMANNIPRRSIFFLPIIIGATTTATMFPSVSTAAASVASVASSFVEQTKNDNGSNSNDDDDGSNNKWITQRLEEETKIEDQQQQQRPFVSAAFSRKEYTNSIVASRDTNISPFEVYDTILQLKTKQQQVEVTGDNGSYSSSNNNDKNLRALDVGAGAGVSTQVIYQQLGYINIDAIDWSGDAWNTNVIENDIGYCPSTVKFYELDDERFVEQWKQKEDDKYDIIVFNFAVNRSKALYFCQNLLKKDGLLLAPINAQQDYWLKQTYQLLDTDGNLLWSAIDVGAWSVQFQPDVTQDTCQGIWCMPYNGFKKLGR